MSSASELPEPDVQILTSGGVRIPAHSSILAMVSPVLDNIMERPVKHGSSERVIPILGVPCDAVTAFIKYLYNSMCTEEQMEKYGIHLLVLSHVYLVPQLKQRCSRGVSQRLTVENAVDVLQLARLCDVPDLYLKCLKQVTARFKAVEQTEGWKFMQEHDPWLELHILRFMDEAESKKKEKVASEERTALVFTTKRRTRVFGAHLQGRVHNGGAVRRRDGKETEPLRQVRDVPRCPDVDKAFGFV